MCDTLMLSMSIEYIRMMPNETHVQQMTGINVIICLNYLLFFSVKGLWIYINVEFNVVIFFSSFSIFLCSIQMSACLTCFDAKRFCVVVVVNKVILCFVLYDIVKPDTTLCYVKCFFACYFFTLCCFYVSFASVVGTHTCLYAPFNINSHSQNDMQVFPLLSLSLTLSTGHHELMLLFCLHFVVYACRKIFSFYNKSKLIHKRCFFFLLQFAL